MRRNILIGVLALSLLVSVAFVAAHRGDSSVQGPNYSEDRHDAMTAAFASGDYDAWKALMDENGMRGHVLDVVTVENFDTFVAMHDAMIAGDDVKADSLRAELGLGQGNRGQGDGKGASQGNGRHAGMQGGRSQGCLMR